MILLILAIVLIILLIIIGSFKSEGQHFGSRYDCEKEKMKGKDLFKSPWN